MDGEALRIILDLKDRLSEYEYAMDDLARILYTKEKIRFMRYDNPLISEILNRVSDLVFEQQKSVIEKLNEHD